jgi:putative endonuclease
MADHNKLGSEGEEKAVAYLQSKSYAILETNWRYRKTEIDIIARDGDTLVIAEVKTRAHWQAEEAEKSVTRAKQSRIIKAANAYVLEKELSFEVRFDVVVLIKSGLSFKITHFVDAFYPIA